MELIRIICYTSIGLRKKTQKEVVRVFDGIEAKIGYLTFKHLKSSLVVYY